jgi:hypothetical protein
MLPEPELTRASVFEAPLRHAPRRAALLDRGARLAATAAYPAVTAIVAASATNA